MNPDGERGESIVVWLDRADGSECRGQVERVATSERVRFASAAELIAVLARPGGGSAIARVSKESAEER